MNNIHPIQDNCRGFGGFSSFMFMPLKSIDDDLGSYLLHLTRSCESKIDIARRAVSNTYGIRYE